MARAAVAALEAVGCKLKDSYFAFGDADVLVTYEAPDAVTAASLTMMPGASGAMSSVETVALLTMDAMKKSAKAQKAYKPPSAKPASK